MSQLHEKLYSREFTFGLFLLKGVLILIFKVSFEQDMRTLKLLIVNPVITFCIVVVPQFFHQNLEILRTKVNRYDFN